MRAQVVQLNQLMHDAHFDDPPATCLSPVGEYNLRLGAISA